MGNSTEFMEIKKYNRKISIGKTYSGGDFLSLKPSQLKNSLS
jgi:hypothetical protein